MGINRSVINAQPISSNYDVAIRMVVDRPDVTAVLAQPVDPNIMVGFYNNALGVVELFVTDPSGLRYVKVI